MDGPLRSIAIYVTASYRDIMLCACLLRVDIRRSILRPKPFEPRTAPPSSQAFLSLAHHGRLMTAQNGRDQFLPVSPPPGSIRCMLGGRQFIGVPVVVARRCMGCACWMWQYRHWQQQQQQQQQNMNPMGDDSVSPKVKPKLPNARVIKHPKKQVKAKGSQRPVQRIIHLP